jgi:hypothetical protein
MKRHLEKATESFRAARPAVEPFTAPRRDEFAVFSGMTSTVRATTSPLSPYRPPSTMTVDPSPSPSQETHSPASVGLPQRFQPVASQFPSHSLSMEAETSPWNQVHPSLIDQLVSFEAQIAPSPAVGEYIQQQYESPHTPHTSFSFPTSTRSASPRRLAYLQTAPPGRPPPHMAQYTEGPSPVSTIPDGDAGAIDPHWGVPQLVPQRTPPSGSYAPERVLRQSGNLSLTEVWSQLVTQMDIAPTGPQQPS